MESKQRDLLGERKGCSASQEEACLRVEKMLVCGAEMPELHALKAQKTGLRPWFLEKWNQYRRIQVK